MTEQPTFFAALEQALDPLLAASNLLSLIDRADRSGLLRSLRDGFQPDGDPVALCLALVAHGVAEAEPDGSGYRLTPAWRALTSDDNFVTVGSVIARGRVVDDMLACEIGYADLSPADRLVFARGVSPNPFSAGLVEGFRRDLAADPYWAGMADGARYLELGCGVAGRLLTLLQAEPTLRAVGVELDPHLAEEARRRAAALGVADRVEFVAGDATTYRGEEPFDAGFWAQWFFPAETREAALASLFANLRSGAVVRAPLFGDHAKMAAEPDGVEARSYATERVMLDGWGVPERTPEQLVAEIHAAGFVDGAVVTRDGGLVAVYARRP
ncbi:hypothetical protein GCM10022237_00740 [Nocardioides ginsengisoli]|uniref:SAM-dependent methyltransferase n=1 Tax=Nocardioides ginsengisoli TaxID=363868 RepID=A0ABW3W158_9ACTN